MEAISPIAWYCGLAGAMAAMICFYALPLGRLTRLIDHPDGVLKLHKSETPLMGGIALLVPSLLVSLPFLAFMDQGDEPLMAVALAAATAALVVGIWDDVWGLSPKLRLLAFAVIVAGTFIAEPMFIIHAWRFSEPLGIPGITLGILSVPLTAFMVIGFINAVNMADGMNGQFLGSVVIWSFFLFYYLGASVGLPFLAIIFTGLVTFAFNLKSRLFSGSSGAYAASIFIALGTIAAYRKGLGSFPAERPIFWFWLPILDCIRLMLARVWSGKSPLFGDRNHFHHLLQYRWREPFPLIVYLTLLAAPGIAGLFRSIYGAITLLISVAVYAVLVYAKAQATNRDVGHDAIRRTAMPSARTDRSVANANNGASPTLMRARRQPEEAA